MEGTSLVGSGVFVSCLVKEIEHIYMNSIIGTSSAGSELTPRLLVSGSRNTLKTAVS